MLAGMGIKAPRSPKPGQFSLCPVCGEISVFESRAQLRTITEEELERAQANVPLAVCQRLIKAMRKSLAEHNPPG